MFLYILKNPYFFFCCSFSFLNQLLKIILDINYLLYLLHKSLCGIGRYLYILWINMRVISRGLRLCFVIPFLKEFPLYLSRSLTNGALLGICCDRVWAQSSVESRSWVWSDPQHSDEVSWTEKQKHFHQDAEGNGFRFRGAHRARWCYSS